MTNDNVMKKYGMSIDEVLNVRAMHGGTVTIAIAWNVPLHRCPSLRDVMCVSSR